MGLHKYIFQMREPACGRLVIPVDKINILPDFILSLFELEIII